MDYSSIIDEASETKYCYARKKSILKNIYIYFGAHKNLIFEKRHVKFCKILYLRFILGRSLFLFGKLTYRPSKE